MGAPVTVAPLPYYGGVEAMRLRGRPRCASAKRRRGCRHQRVQTQTSTRLPQRVTVEARALLGGDGLEAGDQSPSRQFWTICSSPIGQTVNSTLAFSTTKATQSKRTREELGFEKK